jgi:hypothetical protein
MNAQIQSIDKLHLVGNVRTFSLKKLLAVGCFLFLNSFLKPIMDYRGKRTSGEADLSNVSEANIKKLCVGDSEQYCLPESLDASGVGHHQLRVTDPQTSTQVLWVPASTHDANIHTYIFSNLTDGATTAAGQIRCDTGNLVTATKVYVSETDAHGVLRKPYLDSRDTAANMEIYKHDDTNKGVRVGKRVSNVITGLSGYTEFDVDAVALHSTNSVVDGDIISFQYEASGSAVEVPVLTEPSTYGEYRQNYTQIPLISKTLTQDNGLPTDFQGFLAVGAGGNPELVPDDTSNVAYGDDGTYQHVIVQRTGVYKTGFNVNYIKPGPGTTKIRWRLFANGVFDPNIQGLTEELTNNADSRVTTWTGLTQLNAGDQVEARVAQVGGSGAQIDIANVNLHLHLVQVPGTVSNQAFEYNFNTSPSAAVAGQLFTPTGADGTVYINKLDRYGNDFLPTLTKFSENTLLTVRQLNDENKGTIMRLTEQGTGDPEISWANSQWLQDFKDGRPDNNARVAVSFSADTLALSSGGSGGGGSVRYNQIAWSTPGVGHWTGSFVTPTNCTWQYVTTTSAPYRVRLSFEIRNNSASGRTGNIDFLYASNAWLPQATSNNSNNVYGGVAGSFGPAGAQFRATLLGSLTGHVMVNSGNTGFTVYTYVPNNSGATPTNQELMAVCTVEYETNTAPS